VTEELREVIHMNSKVKGTLFKLLDKADINQQLVRDKEALMLTILEIRKDKGLEENTMVRIFHRFSGAEEKTALKYIRDMFSDGFIDKRQKQDGTIYYVINDDGIWFIKVFFEKFPDKQPEPIDLTLK